METDVPRIPASTSLLTHGDDITIGRTDLDSHPFNFQRLTEDGTWVRGHFAAPGWPTTPAHVPTGWPSCAGSWT